MKPYEKCSPWKWQILPFLANGQEKDANELAPTTKRGIKIQKKKIKNKNSESRRQQYFF